MHTLDNIKLNISDDNISNDKKSEEEKEIVMVKK